MRPSIPFFPTCSTGQDRPRRSPAKIFLHLVWRPLTYLVFSSCLSWNFQKVFSSIMMMSHHPNSNFKSSKLWSQRSKSDLIIICLVWLFPLPNLSLDFWLHHWEEKVWTKLCWTCLLQKVQSQTFKIFELVVSEKSVLKTWWSSSLNFGLWSAPSSSQVLVQIPWPTFFLLPPSSSFVWPLFHLSSSYSRWSRTWKTNFPLTKNFAPKTQTNQDKKTNLPLPLDKTSCPGRGKDNSTFCPTRQLFHLEDKTTVKMEEKTK